MKKKFTLGIVVVLSYWASTLVLAVLCTISALFLFKSSHYQSSKLSSVIARGALFPYTTLSKFTNSTFFLAWEKGLLITEQAPPLLEDLKSLQTTYANHTALSPELMSSLDSQYSNILIQLVMLEQLINQSSTATYLLNQTKYTYLIHSVSKHAEMFQLIDSFLNSLSTNFEVNQPLTFLVLFQNNMELRATGGFPGSYAVVRIAKNEPITVEIEDIYVPDGQLKEHVDPPLPIQEAFQQGFWKLRDANWHPDFQESAKNFQWFFAQAGYPDFDGVVAINYTTLEELISITGPVTVTDLGTKVDETNLYKILQRSDDDSFFAGSTKKKDTLNAFKNALTLKLADLSVSQNVQILSLLHRHLDQKNILLTFKDPDLHVRNSALNWEGVLQPVPCNSKGCSIDYFSVFEANLGVNKSNCCVNRSITLKKHIDEMKVIKTTISLKYQNLGPVGQYEKVAGDYKAYVRIYLPKNTLVQPPVIGGKEYTKYIQEMKKSGFLHPIVSQGFSFGDVSELKEVGFWVIVPSGKEQSVELTTFTQLQPETKYTLTIQKQPGTHDFFNHFDIFNNENSIYSDEVQHDLSL